MYFFFFIIITQGIRTTILFHLFISILFGILMICSCFFFIIIIVFVVCKIMCQSVYHTHLRKFAPLHVLGMGDDKIYYLSKDIIIMNSGDPIR